MLHPIENRQTLLDNRLGTLLTLERDSLNIYIALEQASRAAQVKDLFTRQSGEARDHISALERIVDTMRLEMPAGLTRAGMTLHEETNDLLDDSSDGMVDLVALAAALAAGRLAVDIYKTAIALCASMGFYGVEKTLTQSLSDQEQMGSDLEDAFMDCLGESREREVDTFDIDDEWFEAAGYRRPAGDTTETQDWSDSDVS